MTASLVDDPLLPDPGTAEELASRVGALAEVLADTGRRITVVDADWEGVAAASFREVKSLQPSRFADAAVTLGRGARALREYAERVRGIRARWSAARSAPGVVDVAEAGRRTRSELAEAETACAGELRAVTALAPRPPAPPGPTPLQRILAGVFTPSLRMPDSVRTDDGLRGLFGGIGGAVMDAVDRVEQPWAYVPFVSAAIRHAGGVADPAPPSARYRLGELAFDVGTGGVGSPEAAAEGGRAADELLLRRALPDDVFAGDPPTGLIDKIAYRHQWSKTAAYGHMWSDHVLGIGRAEADMPFFDSPEDLRRWAHTVMRKGEMRHGLPRGREDPGDPARPWLKRTAYWHEGFLLIVDHKNPDGGTMFVPDSGRAYFERKFR